MTIDRNLNWFYGAIPLFPSTTLNSYECHFLDVSLYYPLSYFFSSMYLKGYQDVRSGGLWVSCVCSEKKFSKLVLVVVLSFHKQKVLILWTGGCWPVYTKRTKLGHGWPVNHLARVGSGRPMVGLLLDPFKMKQTCIKKLCIIIVVLYKSVVINLTN